MCEHGRMAWVARSVLTDHAASVVVSGLLQPCQLAWAARVAFEEQR
jgi:hypothetical protein